MEKQQAKLIHPDQRQVRDKGKQREVIKEEEYDSDSSHVGSNSGDLNSESEYNTRPATHYGRQPRGRRSGRDARGGSRSNTQGGDARARTNHTNTGSTPPVKSGIGGEVPGDSNPGPSSQTVPTTDVVSKPKVRTYDSNYSMMYIPSSGDTDQTAVLQKAGLRVKTFSGPGTHNTHAVSAGFRYAATAYALVQLYRLGVRKAVSVFGSLRDHQINDFLNTGLADADKMELTIYRPVIVPQDISRVLPATLSLTITQGPLPSDKFKGFLLNDIYMFDEGPLDPDILGAMVMYGPVFWIGHRFNGVMGTIHDEGGWLRTWKDNDYVIVSRPDIDQPAYPDHPPLDWLTPSGSIESLTWNTTARFGKDTVVIKFIEIDCNVKNMQGEVAPPFAREELAIPVKNWWTENMMYYIGWNKISKLLLKMSPRQTAIVDVAMRDALQEWLIGRSRTQHTFKQMCLKAQGMVGRSKLALLKSLFSKQTKTILMDTCYSAFYGDISALAYEMAAYHVVSGEQVHSFNLAQSKIAETPSAPIDYRLLLGAVVAVVLMRWFSRSIGLGTGNIFTTVKHACHKLFGSIWLQMARLFPRVSQSASEITGKFLKRHQLTLLTRIVMHAITVPIEECLKRIHPLIGYGLPISEWVLKMTNPHIMILPALIAATPVVFMHLWATSLPFWQGCLVHFAWNSVMEIYGMVITMVMSKWLMPWIEKHQVAIESTKGDFGLLPLIGCITLFWVLRWCYRRQTRVNASDLTAQCSISNAPSHTWTLFKQHYHEDPWEMRPTVDTWAVEIAKFPLDQGFIASQATSHFTKKVLDPSMKITGNLDPELDYQPKSGVWWFLPTQVPFYSAARTDANLLATLEARILVAPVIGQADQKKAWDLVPNYYQRVTPILDDDIMDIEEAEKQWLSGFSGSKFTRAWKALEQVRECPLDDLAQAYTKVKVMVKTDEVLCKARNPPIDGDFGPIDLKPRAIINVNPLVQAETGPWILIITERLKRIWTWDYQLQQPFTKEGWNYYVTYGGDSTDYKLTQWMHQACHQPSKTVCILVSGDDSLVIITCPDGTTRILEGDFAIFDQSQGEGVLLHEAKGSIFLGMPPSIARRQAQLGKAQYLCPSRTSDGGMLRIDHPDRWERVTGGGNTSFGNTSTNGDAWVEVLSTCEHNTEAIQRGFAQLGFDLKLKTWDDPRRCTFLKGMWYDVGETKLVWGPLPSRILKMGKSFKDPCTLYRTKNRKAATCYFASDLAKSYDVFLKIPLVREYISRHMMSRMYRAPENVMKVEGTGRYRDKVVTNYEFILSRYDIEESDLREMQAMVAVSPVGTFLCHPGFARLALIDYG